jgi:hypothetical protein
MRRITGTIGATLAIVAFLATSAAPASADIDKKINNIADAWQGEASGATVLASWIPLEEPAGGPYFGKLDADTALASRWQGYEHPELYESLYAQNDNDPMEAAATSSGERAHSVL